MLQLQHISKVYHTGNQEFHALKDISIRFRENEFVYSRAIRFWEDDVIKYYWGT